MPASWTTVARDILSPETPLVLGVSLLSQVPLTGRNFDKASR